MFWDFARSYNRFCGNRQSSTETGDLATTTYNPAQQMVTFLESAAATTTYSYDLNRNTTSVVLPPGSAPITISCDKENRLAVHQSGSSVATYALSAPAEKCRVLGIRAD